MHPFPGRLTDERPDWGAIALYDERREMDKEKAGRLIRSMAEAVLTNAVPSMEDLQALNEAGYRFERRPIAGMDGVKVACPDMREWYLTMADGSLERMTLQDANLFAELMGRLDSPNGAATLRRVAELSNALESDWLKGRLYARMTPMWAEFPEDGEADEPEPETETETVTEPDNGDGNREKEEGMKRTMEEQAARIAELEAELERLKAESRKEPEPETEPEPEAESKANPDIAEEVSLSALFERMRQWCAERQDVAAVRKNAQIVTPIRIEGNTKPYKEELKEMGFRYARKGFWYYGQRQAEEQGRKVVA